MNKELCLAEEDPASTLYIENLGSLTPDELKQELINERQRLIIMEKDLFKAQNESRRLNSSIKTLQELNTLNAKNRNNTSSAFTLPSEFK